MVKTTERVLSLAIGLRQRSVEALAKPNFSPLLN